MVNVRFFFVSQYIPTSFFTTFIFIDCEANIKSRAKLIKDTRSFICQCESLNNCYVIKVKDKVEKICTKRNLQILLSFIYNILIAFIVSAVFANDKGIKGHIYKALFLRLGSF
jgi:hypothetical protein